MLKRMATSDRTLRDEIGPTRPFQSPAQEAFVGLLRTASMLRRRFAAILEPHDLTPSQYNVLRILRGADEPLPTMQIRERLIEETPGVTRLVDHLDEKGLVQRERCPDDRRRVLCAITPAGLRLLEKLDDPIDRFDEESLDMLGVSEQEQLIVQLDAIRAGLREKSG